MKYTRFDTFIERIYSSTDISSLNGLASCLDINRSNFSHARKRDAIPAKWILKLFSIYGLNPEWLENGIHPIFLKHSKDSDAEFKKVPKVKARLCAGAGSFEVGSEIEGYYSFRIDWLSKKGTADKMVMLDIFGNSMEPELKYGDTVLIDESQKDVFAGALYAIGIDDTIMIKRVEKHPNGLVLLSDNTKYEPIYQKKEDINNVRIIGKVIWVCRELK